MVILFYGYISSENVFLGGHGAFLHVVMLHFIEIFVFDVEIVDSFLLL